MNYYSEGENLLCKIMSGSMRLLCVGVASDQARRMRYAKQFAIIRKAAKLSDLAWSNRSVITFLSCYHYGSKPHLGLNGSQNKDRKLKRKKEQRSYEEKTSLGEEPQYENLDLVYPPSKIKGLKGITVDASRELNAAMKRSNHKMKSRCAN